MADDVIELRLRVSIRAPARGATMPEVSVAVEYVFQSAPPHGERQDRHPLQVEV